MHVRLAEPVVALSGIGDLARVRSTGAAARSCFIACRLARAMDLPDPVVRDVFYTALLQHVGCVGYAHEAAAVFAGRDVEMNLAGSHTDFRSPADLFKTFIPELSAGVDVLTRMRILTAALTKARRLGPVIHRAACEVGAATARRIGLSPGVAAALRHVEEWYDGKGGYLGASGEEIPITARVVLAAFTANVFAELGGADAAGKVVSRRGGRELDPAVADTFERHGRDILRQLDEITVDDEVLNEEPTPHLTIDDVGLDEVVLSFGEIVDLKTPHAHGGARDGFVLAGAAAVALGLDAITVAQIRRAAALRDVGKAAISNVILEKDEPLTRAEVDELQLHAYRTERLLARAPSLTVEASLAGMHHEYEDGSGYHRGARAADIPIGAKILATVDTYIAATRPNTRRDGTSTNAAAEHLEKLANRGTLNPDVTLAVLAATHGSSAPINRTHPAGLSDRQVEVVQLLARGLSNKQIAQRLVISPRTAEHHVQDIYLKIGASSRAAAALFAMEHRLL